MNRVQAGKLGAAGGIKSIEGQRTPWRLHPWKEWLPQLSEACVPSLSPTVEMLIPWLYSQGSGRLSERCRFLLSLAAVERVVAQWWDCRQLELMAEGTYPCAEH